MSLYLFHALNDDSNLQGQRSDAHASNLAGIPVHIRVGADDTTTPPWHSRRMLRLLKGRPGAGAAPESRSDSEETEGEDSPWPVLEEVPKQARCCCYFVTIRHSIGVVAGPLVVGHAPRQRRWRG